MLTKCAITFCLVIGIITTSTEGIEDGDFIKITSVADGNVLTVTGTDPLEESNIKVEPWKNLANQKWLAVQAVVASSNVLLLPQRQHWNWNRFIRKGVVNRETKDRDGELPDWTMVLTLDSRSNIIQQPRVGRGNQQWKSVNIGSSRGKILIKSIANGQCLKNSRPDASPIAIPTNKATTTTATTTTTAKPSFFQKFKGMFGGGRKETTTTTTTTTTTPIPYVNSGVYANNAKTSDYPRVTIAECNELNTNQQWTVEKITNLQV